MSEIDLTKVEPPQFIEEISYNTIKEQMLKLLEGSGFEVRPSDPSSKLLDIAALREVGLRQKVNEAIKELFLAFARDMSLDNIANFFKDLDEERNIVKLKRDGEDDDKFRERALGSFDQFTTAGASKAYEYWAKYKANVKNVKNVKSYTPEKGTGKVNVIVLFDDHLEFIKDSNALSKALTKIRHTVNRLDVAPTTDIITVKKAELVKYRLDVNIYVPDGADPQVIREMAKERLEKYIAARHGVSLDVTNTCVGGACFVNDSIHRIDVTITRYGITQDEDGREIETETEVKNLEIGNDECSQINQEYKNCGYKIEVFPGLEKERGGSV